MKSNYIYLIIILQSFPFLFGVEFVSFGNDLSEIAGNAKHTAMGGIGVALESESSLYKNPSLITMNYEETIAISRNKTWNGLVEHTQFVFNPKQNGKIFTSYGILLRSIDNIHNTEDAWNDDGTIPNGNINYENIGEFNHQEILGYLSLSKKMNNWPNIASIGMSIKPSLTILDDNYSIGIGIDLGTFSQINNYFSFGCVIQDLFAVNYWSSGNTELYYPSFKMGVLFNNSDFIKLGVDVLKSLNNKENLKFSFGSDIQVIKGFHFYFGTSSLFEWTSGFSTKTNIIDFMYSINQNRALNDLAFNHKISLIFDIKAVKKLSKGITP